MSWMKFDQTEIELHDEVSLEIVSNGRNYGVEVTGAIVGLGKEALEILEFDESSPILYPFTDIRRMKWLDPQGRPMGAFQDAVTERDMVRITYVISNGDTMKIKGQVESMNRHVAEVRLEDSWRMAEVDYEKILSWKLYENEVWK